MITEQEQLSFVVETIRASAWHLAALQLVHQLALPDWAIGAGFVRNAVWDRLNGFTAMTPLNDIDVLYFDRSDASIERDMGIEEALFEADPDRPWSVHNQARMHARNNDRPYRSTEDAMSFWLETPTCVGVRLEGTNGIEVIAPHGLADLINMRARPTAAGRLRMEQYQARMAAKNWPGTWPKVVVSGLD